MNTNTTATAGVVSSTELGRLAEASGMVNLLNHGGASCVYSEGCNGVTQKHLERFTELTLSAERERIKNGIMALVLTAENCKGDAGVDTARKALALRIATLVDGHADLVLNEAGKRIAKDFAQEVRQDKVTSAASRAIAAMERERDEKKAALPPGTCAECDGEGEQGGQFCGGYWECEACGGTGKLATDGGNDWNVIDRLPETPGVELEVFTQLQPEPRVIKFIPDAGQFFYQDCAHQSQNALFTEQRHIVGWRAKKQPNTERSGAERPTGAASSVAD